MTTRLVAIADERFFSGREHTQVIVTNFFRVYPPMLPIVSCS